MNEPLDKAPAMAEGCIKPVDIADFSSATRLCLLKAEYPNGDGRTLSLVKRCEKAAMYALERGDVIHGYEVFTVRTKPAAVLFGKHYPPKEIYPSNTDFGKSAVSCRTLERAEAYYELLRSGKTIVEAQKILRERKTHVA